MNGVRFRKNYRGSGVLNSLTNFASGVVNKGIDLLPLELNVPGYQYCGPGTDLNKRLRRGDPGINKLDRACKEHDIAYSRFADNANRSIADKILAEKAWERVRASDSSLSERAVALAVTGIMKGKAKLGGGKHKGVCKNGRSCKKGKKRHMKTKR